MKQPTKKLVIRRVLKAERERVFNALTNPVKIANWFYGMETGQAKVTSDFRVGGKYSIEMFNDEVKTGPSGKYLQIVPPKRLVMSWSCEGYVKDSKVTIELIEKGKRTELVITHELPKDQVSSHRQGWKNCLDHLEDFLGREFGSELTPPAAAT